jgi:hypothetical protein
MDKKKREPRSKWHEPHRLAEVKTELKKRAKNRMVNAKGLSLGAAEKLKASVSLHIFRDCDLRATLEEKSISCNKFSAWTAFINKKGNLVHIVPRDGDFHVRVPLYYSLANASTSQIERVLASTIYGRLK